MVFKTIGCVGDISLICENLSNCIMLLEDCIILSLKYLSTGNGKYFRAFDNSSLYYSLYRSSYSCGEILIMF